MCARVCMCGKYRDWAVNKRCSVVYVGLINVCLHCELCYQVLGLFLLTFYKRPDDNFIFVLYRSYLSFPFLETSRQC